MAKLPIEVKGVRKLIKKMGGTREEIAGATAAAIYAEGFQIMDESQKLVPVNVGILRDSKYVAPPVSRRGRLPEVEIGYGTRYALAVHEKEAKHNPPTRRFYLRDPFMKARGGYANRLARRIGQFWKARIFVEAIKGRYPSKPKYGKEHEGKAHSGKGGSKGGGRRRG